MSCNALGILRILFSVPHIFIWKCIAARCVPNEAEQRLETFDLILLCPIPCSTNLRNNYRRQQSVSSSSSENLNLARKTSTSYNKIVHKLYLEYKQKIIHKLRLLQSENPKEYSKIVRG